MANTKPRKYFRGWDYEPEFLTVTQCARIVGCTTATVRYHILQGHLPASIRGAATYIVRRDDLRAYLEGRPMSTAKCTNN